MNLKNLFNVLFALVVLTLVGSTTFAQQTWFVNNQIGNDGRNGLSATIPSPDDFVTGPKKSIGGAQGAQAAAVNGDVVVVANTGVAYGTATTEPATITITKQLTFQSTGGTPEISSGFAVATGALANEVKFTSGAFRLSGGLTLTTGTLNNASQLITVNGGLITVAAAATTTKVTGQLLYAGTVSFSYGATYTTADEFPNSGTFGNLTTTAGDLTLEVTSAVMGGVFNTAGVLNLGGNTLTVTNADADVTHAYGGNVTNGTLAFSIAGTAARTITLNGAIALPSVTVNNASAQDHILAIAQPTAITGTLTVNGRVTVSTSAALRTIGTSGFSGNVITMNSSRTLTLSGTGAAVNIHGNVVLNTTGLNGSGNGVINFVDPGAFALTINGSVTNSAGVVLSGATVTGAGVVSFAAATGSIVINGNVRLDGTLSGNSSGVATDYQQNAEIRFASTTTPVTITGTVTNTGVSSSSSTGSAAGTAVSHNLRILFAATSGVVRADGGIVNTATVPDAAVTGLATPNVDNGTILFTARAAGTVGTSSNRVGTVQNGSVSSVASNGLIDFGAAATGTFFGTTVAQSALGAGGDILFGNHALDITGNIQNQRTATGADISVPAGAGTVTHSIGGFVANQGASLISIDLTGNDIVSITGSVDNTGSGSVTFPVAGAGSITVGGLVVSAGSVSIPTSHTANLAINGTVNISGGTASLLASGAGETITIAGNVSITAGTVNTTGRTGGITLNSVNITLGGATTSPSFTAATLITIGNPSPTSLVNVNIGGFNPSLAGGLTVNNTTGLAEAVRVTGGTLTVPGALTFTAGKVVIADQAVIRVQGAFVNTAGYSTTDQGRVMMNAAGAGQAISGAGNFGTIEFNSPSPTLGSNIKLIGTVYLTSGVVTLGANTLTIDNSTVLPTIVRNNGSFSATPTFASNVNVTYIGGDKPSGNELPTTAGAPTRLQNLTVATTNGTNVAGRGVITVATATTVNGTILVNSGQTLLIDGVTVAMKGAAITLNGDIANEGAGLLQFAATAGTVVTGSGFLPNIEIAAGSAGNMINGTAIVHQLVGTDNTRNGGPDDFDATTASANGTVNFVAGTNSATFNLNGVSNSTQVGNVTTNGTGNTMILGKNLVSSGSLTHNAGVVNVGAFIYEIRGTAVTLGTTANASFTGAGSLKIFQPTAGASGSITSDATGSTIGINVELNNTDPDNADDNLALAGGPLTIAGNFTITDGELQLAQNLTLTGSAFTIAAAGSTTGAGVLRLNATTPPLTFSYTGSPTIANLRISNDVNLAGSGTTVTITGTLTHDGGVFNFGNRDITVTGNFTRTAGSYLAGTGYLEWGAGAVAFTQGTGFSIPNLKVSSNLTPATSQNFVVSNNLYLNAATLTHTVGGSARLTLGVVDGAVPTITVVGAGNVDVAPAFAVGSANYVFTGATTPIIVSSTSRYWPAAPATLANDLTINMTNAADVVQFNEGRTVNGTSTLNLTRGVLALNDVALTLATGMTINKNAAASFNLNVDGDLTDGSGSLAAPAASINYVGASQSTSEEYTQPTQVTNVTSNAGNGSTLTIDDARTITGNLVGTQNITVTANTLVAGTISIAANKVLTITGVTLSTPSDLAVSGTITGTGTLAFTGATGQAVTLAGTTTLNNIALNMSGIRPVLDVDGGNLNLNTIQFVNGILNMNDNTLILPRPQLDVTYSGQAFDRSGVTGTNVGHVVGNIQRAALNGDGQATVNGRFTFPVGTLDGDYRELTLTFTPNYSVQSPTTFTVNHVEGDPLGDPSVTGYDDPGYYWVVSANPSLSQVSQRFDIELQGTDIPEDVDVDDLRMIRRQSQEINSWELISGIYSNYETTISGVTTSVVGATSTVGGLIAAGSRFTIGVPAVDIPATVSGVVTYNNTANTPVEGVAVTLNPGGLSDTTDAAGAYSIPNVPAGEYTVTAASVEEWLGADAGDALAVLKGVAHNPDLTGNYLLAADVSDDGVLTSLDALRIQRRDAGLDATFPAGDWFFTSGAVTVEGEDAVVNLKALAMGDVNGDAATGTPKQTPSVQVMKNNKINANPGSSIQVPVTVGAAMNLGAMSMTLTYPVELAKFEGIATKAEGLTVNQTEGKVKISWASLSALNLKENDVLLTLKLKTTDKFVAGSLVDVEIDNTSKLYDVNGNAVKNAVLKSTPIEGFVPTEFALKQNYPNPFNPTTVISYDLPVAGNVSLVVFNSLGEEVTRLVNETQSAGTYKFNWNASGLTSGLYFYRIDVNAGEKSFSKTQKMMLLK